MNVDNLGTAAAEIAMQSASDYVRKHNLIVRDYGAAIECLRSWCKIMLPQALADAKAAADCGMFAVASETFRASMVLAGIEAAKEFGSVA